MQTNRQVIEAFRDFAADRTGRPSDDTRYSQRLVLFYMQMYRTRILYEKRLQSMQAMGVNRHNVQTIPCISVHEADQNECPCAPPKGTKFLKSDHPVPRPIGGRYFSVTTHGGDVGYDYLRWQDFRWKIHSRIPAERKAPYYTLKDTGEGSYLYLYNDEFKGVLAVNSMFENPLEVQRFPICGEEQKPLCTPLDEEFIVDADLLPRIFDMAFDRLVKFHQSSHTKDIVNNDAEDSAQAGSQRSS